MTDIDPLVRPLVELVAELAFRLDGSLNDDVEPRWAVKALEWIAFVCGELPPDQRERVARIVADMAAGTEPGAHKRFLESFADDFGLLEEDVDEE